MTSESKERLLKILLNEQNESPSTNVGTIISDGAKSISISNTLIRNQLTYNNYTIVLYTTGKIVLYDNEYNELMNKYLVVSGVQVTLYAIDIDSEGNMYGIGWNGSKYYLYYLNNITIPNANNEYVLEARKSYDIYTMLTDIGAELGAGVVVDRFMLKKSPIDSRFIIVVDGHSTETYNYNLLIINYTVTVGSENTYEYRAKKVGTYNSNSTQDVYIDWTTDNSYLYLFSMSFTYGNESYYTPFAVNYYWCTVDFGENTSISQTLILSNPNCIKTGVLFCCKLKSSNEIWFVDAVKSSQDITTKLYLYQNNNLSVKFSVDGIEYSNSNMLYINNQLFIGILPQIDENSINKIILFQVIDNNLNLLLNYEDSYHTNALFITNDFNLFNIYINCSRYKYIYGPHYNGTEYFSDNSLNSVSTTLYGINTEGSTNIVPVFARDLYNKTLLGNSVISKVQVPYNYLNNSIITGEKLISKNNNVIDEDSEEIIKNEYEEIYINNVDAYKIFDDNIGHTYNQNGSFELAKSIYSDFVYKIEKYRVNYLDGTYKQYDLNHIQRDDTNATIEIYVRNENVDNIQIYDKNFTTPFVTIDFKDYELNKIYKITERVKIE